MMLVNFFSKMLLNNFFSVKHLFYTQMTSLLNIDVDDDIRVT